MGISYSLTEHAVGTWIDGSTVYEKTIDFGALPNATTKYVAHGITNLKVIVAIKGVAMTKLDGTGRTMHLPASDPTALKNAVSCGILEDGRVVIVTDSDRRNYVYTYVTLQYTKTTS